MQGLEKFTMFIFICFFGKGCPNKRNCHMSTLNHSIYQFMKIDCTSVDLPQGNTTLKPTTVQPLVKKVVLESCSRNPFFIVNYSTMWQRPLYHTN